MSNITRVGWISGRNRTSYDLLWSCLATILACTWTTLHLNVPSSNDGRFRIFLRKAKWTAITILAPEVTAGLALSQWYKAGRDWLDSFPQCVKEKEKNSWKKNITEAVKGLWLKQPKTSRGEWVMTHSFFAEMGGLVIGLQQFTYLSHCF